MNTPAPLSPGRTEPAPWRPRLRSPRPGLARLAAFTSLLLLALALALALGPAPARAGFAYESTHEITATGDFDGDGREDVVIVDKATGSYRVAHQLVAGQHSWSAPRASGIAPVTSIAVGRLLDTSRDALAFTGPDANRVNILAADNPASAGFPLPVFVPTIGPNLAVALDAGGAGNTPLDDLFVASVYNGAAPNQISLLRNNAATFTQIGASLVVPGPFGAGNAVTVKAGVPPMAASVQRGPGSDIFRAYNLSAGTLLVSIQLGSLPTNVNFVHAHFSQSALAQFLFYEPGTTNGGLRLRPVLEPNPGVFTFGTEVVFNLGAPIQQVLVLPTAAGAKLLVIHGGGEIARVYAFDGINAPTLEQELAPAAGETFAGAAPLANGSFTMLSAAGGSSTSTRFQTYHPGAGGQFVAGQTGALPFLSAYSASANVFQFESEPFVAAAPNLLRTLNAGDWSTALDASALPQLTVTAESFVSSSSGLDNPAPVDAGPAHPLMHYGMVNQFAPPLSLFSLARPVGDEIAEVKIAPAPGTFETSIKVTLTTTSPGMQIFYRTGASGAWTLYSTPFPLFTDTTVAYYAKPAAGISKSIIRHATYQFSKAPDALDSDGDGVPDYVELAKGLNPKGGPDSDGDGFSDLEELIRGTNPNDKNSVPPSQPRLELKSSLDLVETPRPLDGTVNALTVAETNTALRVHDIPGGLLRYSRTENLNVPGLLNPSVLLSNIVLDARQRLLSVATERHFDIATSGTNKTLGRELLALRPVPDVAAGLEVNYPYGGGALATEANNWIAAAQAAAASVTHERFVHEIGVDDTLAALLVERKIGEVLVARGQTFGSNLTLFPFRPADAARSSLSQATLLSIESPGPNGEPAFQLRKLHQAATNDLAPGVAFSAPLRAVASDLYRLSSASNEVLALPSPVDALRRFLWTGELHSNSVAFGSLTDADRAAASAAATQILASMPPRPTTNLTLFVRADTFGSECVLLDAPLSPSGWSLFLPGGEPFRLLENFALPPGSVIHVLGFTDVPAHGCAGQPLEVVALGLDSVPAVSSTDTDGDLLPDDLELLVFGDLGQGGNGDADGDGISNFQEAMDGTDLLDGLSKGPQQANVGPPEIQVGAQGGQLKLSWNWPEAYANKIQFTVFAAGDLGQAFQIIPATLSHPGPDQFEAVLPNVPAPSQFYRVSLSLK